MKIIVLTLSLVGLFCGSAFAGPISYQCIVGVSDQQDSDVDPHLIRVNFKLLGKTGSKFLIDAQAVVTRDHVFTGDDLKNFDWNTKDAFFSMRIYVFDTGLVKPMETSVSASYRKNGRTQTDSTSSTRGDTPAASIRSEGRANVKNPDIDDFDTYHSVMCGLLE